MDTAEKLSLLIANQSELSRRTGLSQSAISAACAGKRRLYLDQAWKIARALGVPLDYLADAAQREPPAPPAELPEDERSILKLYRALQLSEDEALRRLSTDPGVRHEEITADLGLTREVEESAAAAPKPRAGGRRRRRRA